MAEGYRLKEERKEFGGERVSLLFPSPPTDCSFATKVGERWRTILLPRVTPG